jgi:hypothetical protein
VKKKKKKETEQRMKETKEKTKVTSDFLGSKVEMIFQIK